MRTIAVAQPGYYEARGLARGGTGGGMPLEAALLPPVHYQRCRFFDIEGARYSEDGKEFGLQYSSASSTRPTPMPAADPATWTTYSDQAALIGRLGTRPAGPPAGSRAGDTPCVVSVIAASRNGRYHRYAPPWRHSPTLRPEDIPSMPNEWLPAVMGTRATARWTTTGCSVRETVDPLDGD